MRTLAHQPSLLCVQKCVLRNAPDPLKDLLCDLYGHIDRSVRPHSFHDFLMWRGTGTSTAPCYLSWSATGSAFISLLSGTNLTSHGSAHNVSNFVGPCRSLMRYLSSERHHKQMPSATPSTFLLYISSKQLLETPPILPTSP